MGGIERRDIMKAAAVGGLAMTIGNEARAQGGPVRTAVWPNRRMLDLLKIDHPIIQAPMGLHTSPAMPVAVVSLLGRDTRAGARSCRQDPRANG